MKSILVPTDFSEHAGYALDVAVKLANRFNAKLFLLNSQDLPPYWDNLPTQEKEKLTLAMRGLQQAEEKLQKKKRENYPSVPIEVFTTPESLPGAVNHFIKKHGIDLIVIGSHGASGKSEFFIGSNAQKVIRAVHCPALVIKRPLEKLDFKKVVYASNFHETEMEGFLFFKNIIKHFIPEIHLVYIQHTIIHPPVPVQLETMKPFELAAAPLKCQSHIFNDLSVDSGIRSFADELNANLIAISYHERRPLKRMLIGSNVEAVINHADLPVLTVDF